MQKSVQAAPKAALSLTQAAKTAKIGRLETAYSWHTVFHTHTTRSPSPRGLRGPVLSMPPSKPLPYPPHFPTSQAYVSSLLSFASDPLFKTLCGGVHILDFFIRDSLTPPIDLYHSILPTEWIYFFSTQDIDSILDHLLRTPIAQLPPTCPDSLAQFITDVRVHSLCREFTRLETINQKPSKKDGETWALNAGMRPKKIHEVWLVYPCIFKQAKTLKSYFYSTLSYFGFLFS